MESISVSALAASLVFFFIHAAELFDLGYLFILQLR